MAHLQFVLIPPGALGIAQSANGLRLVGKRDVDVPTQAADLLRLPVRQNRRRDNIRDDFSLDLETLFIQIKRKELTNSSSSPSFLIFR